METPPGIRLENVTRFFRECVPGGDAPLRFTNGHGGKIPASSSYFQWLVVEKG